MMHVERRQSDVVILLDTHTAAALAEILDQARPNHDLWTGLADAVGDVLQETPMRKCPRCMGTGGGHNAWCHSDEAEAIRADYNARNLALGTFLLDHTGGAR